MRRLPLAAVLLAVSCATAEPPPVPVAPEASPPAPAASPVVTAPAAAARELGFDPSPDDRPHLGATGFTGTAKALLPDGTEIAGPRVFGVKPGSGLEAAGVRKDDVLVGIGGVRLAPGERDPIGRFRELLLRHAPDTETDVELWRADGGLRTVRVLLGRQPPVFARIETPAAWFESGAANGATDALIREALALDGGEARYEDVLARNRRHAAKRDALRLREVTEAHMNLAAHEPLAIDLATEIAGRPSAAARIAAGTWRAPPGGAPVPPPGTELPQIVESVAAGVAELDGALRAALSAWTEDDRAFVASHFEKLTERLNQGEYLADDEVPSRERTNRRIVALCAKADGARIAAAADRARALVAAWIPALTDAATRDGREGLLAAKDTPAGRVEVWGRGNSRHDKRCAFVFDLGGNDVWADVAARADLAHPVSIAIDVAGDDLYAASSPFGLCGALGGIAVLEDVAGDDQYLARDWCQGAAVCGFALLADHAGRDVYHAQNLSQGIGLAGAGVVADFAGADLYTGARFCQGIGLPGGVGAVVDRAGDDRYVCTGRYDSDYGDVAQFSGWGQGVGFGFRHVASGGIGLLLDREGDDVYEAGNFSQGGGYFYAWGILWDARGRDRYVGSRYAQGFAAHQAVGTFLEGAGDDLYQSHAGVAQGLSWDETSVVFHDMGGNDRYETAPGFSLAAAAHNGLVLFLDDAGDDVYAGRPARAGSNEYHGGRSFALFVDRGGADTYAGLDAKEWNDRAAVRDEGGYHADLPAGGASEMRALLR